ncbi:MAG: HAD-IA family hydrolase [Lachnospiraceae bacterium]|nr:HAD-IA family hydrolase [Lachnospiraceae bacterium]
MNNIKLIIFDLDGTLFNTKPGIMKAIMKTMDEKGLQRPSEEICDTFIGPPIEDSFVRVYGVSREESKNLSNCFRGYYGEDDYLYRTEEYEGMRETLAELKKRGMKLALATYKKEWMAVKLCRHFGYDEFLDCMHGSDPEGKRTKAGIINMCMEECGCTNEETVMVGDTDFDAVGASKAGTSFIGVTYGCGFTAKEDVEAYEGAVAIDFPKELLEL